MMIFNNETKYRIVKFDLLGELYYDQSFDDKDFYQKTLEIIEKKLNCDASRKKIKCQNLFDHLNEQGQENNKFNFSKTFLNSSTGKLFRIASIVDIQEGQEAKDDASFSLSGAVQISIGNSEST